MFSDKCLSGAIVTTAQDTPAANSYDGPIDWELNQFTSDPTGCPIIYECTGVTPEGLDCAKLNFDGVFDEDPTDGKIDITPTQADYESGDIPPGTYTVTICGTVDLSEDENASGCEDFVIVINDPCDPPTSITVPEY